MFRSIKVGDIYEDCAYHPVLCTESYGDNVAGVSLLDASMPRSCSIKHCGVRKMTMKEVRLRLKHKKLWLECEANWRATYDIHSYDRAWEANSSQ